MSRILLLPQECLLAAESELSVYGRVVLKLLKDDVNRLSEEHSSSIALSQVHLRGLAALLTSCQCVQLEDFLFRVRELYTDGNDSFCLQEILHFLESQSLP